MHVIPNWIVSYKCWHGIGMPDNFMLGWRDMILVWFRTSFHKSLGEVSWWCLIGQDIIPRWFLGGASWPGCNSMTPVSGSSWWYLIGQDVILRGFVVVPHYII